MWHTRTGRMAPHQIREALGYGGSRQHRHPRLRVPVHPAHRPAHPGAVGAQRDPSLGQRCGGGPAAQSEGYRGLRRAPELHRARRASAGRTAPAVRDPPVGDLLRHADAGPPAGGTGGTGRGGGVRPRPGGTGFGDLGASGGVAGFPAGLDEPLGSGHRVASGGSGGGGQRRGCPGGLRNGGRPHRGAAVSPRGGPHGTGDGDPPALPLPDLRLRPYLEA